MSVSLISHPRLLYKEAAWENLTSDYSLDLLQQASALVHKRAKEFLKSKKLHYLQNTHNEHLLRARVFQTAVFTLLVEWKRTQNPEFRAAVLEQFQNMKDWEYWSWIAWKSKNSDPTFVWDLSYGENATTLAVAYDLLHSTLTPIEKKLFLDIAYQWVVPTWLKHTTEDEAWWSHNPNSNWLPVCACGAGMVALAMYEEIREAEIILKKADHYITQYMQEIRKFDGGWPEGTPYWNYGMRYAFMYLLSYENAFTKEHDAMNLPSTLSTLWFPLYFSPHGIGCGFGDLNHNVWAPLPFHLALAKRFNEDALYAILTNLICQEEKQHDWPSKAELLLLCTNHQQIKPSKEIKEMHYLYDGLGWGFIADRLPHSAFYLSVRGGTTEEHHNIEDLMSWHCILNHEQFITSLSNQEYLDTTFSRRRYELAEIRYDTKNTILIGGVGIKEPATIPIQKVSINNHPGFYLTATTALQSASKPLSIARLFFVIDYKYLCVIDHVTLEHTNRIETRLHSYKNVEQKGNQVLLKGQQTASLHFFSNIESIVAISETTPTNINETPAKVIRYSGRDLHKDVTFVTILSLGEPSVKATIHEMPNSLEFHLEIDGVQETIKTTKDLVPLNP